jgi:hypothetical protein
MKKFRKFEDSIIDAIDRATFNDLSGLAEIIKRTKIKKNYDLIISSWNRKITYLNYNHDFCVPESIREQEHGNKITSKIFCYFLKLFQKKL